MSQNVYDVLAERGFIAQCTHPEELRDLLGREKVKFYIGFDATADSLTAGHFLTIMAMIHMQKAGHIPVALMGGGTTMVGDPSGKSDMRKMMTKETIDHNVERFKEQISHFLDTSEGKKFILLPLGTTTKPYEVNSEVQVMLMGDSAMILDKEIKW